MKMNLYEYNVTPNLENRNELLIKLEDSKITYNDKVISDDNIIDNVYEIFDELNKEKVHIGIVLNNNDEVIGMITMEDILDELVGENTVRELKGDNV